MGSTVDVLKDGSSIGTTTATTNGTWTLLVTLDEGVNTFTATATNSSGNTGTSGAVIITLDSVVPGVSITSTPQSVNTASFTLIGTVEAGSTVDVFKNGSSIGTTTATTNGAWTLLVTLDEGVNTFTATATDSAGNTSDATDAVIITLDSMAPGVSITNTPQSVNTESFTLIGGADAGSVVDVLKDGSSIGTTTATMNRDWTLLVTLTDGANTFTATATDGTGNTSDATDAVIITLDTGRPGVTITSTSGGDGGTANTRTLSYTAIFSEGVSGFGEGDIMVTGTANVGSPAVTSFSASADNRTYTFNVVVTTDGSAIVSIDAEVAQDIAGNGNTASSNYALTINSIAPGVSISTRTPQTVNAASFTLTGTADAGSTVDVFKNGSSIGTTTATTSTAWTLLVTLDEGVNTFTATATDNNGNTSDATDAVIITLDSVAPVAVPSISISPNTLVATVGSSIDVITIDSSGGGAVEGYSIAPTLPAGLTLRRGHWHHIRHTNGDCTFTHLHHHRH